MDFRKVVGVRFLRLSGHRIDRSIAGRVFRLKIVLLLCQREDAAYNTLDVLQRVPAQVTHADLIQPDDPRHAQTLVLLRERYVQYRSMELEKHAIIVITPDSITSWGPTLGG